MKTIAFISKRKMVAQGLEAALAGRPELDLTLLPLVPPTEARAASIVYSPSLILMDVAAETEQESLLAFCRDLRQALPDCRLVFLLSEDGPHYQALSIRAKQNGWVDDFVFYDNSMTYLLAKLAAL